MVIAVTQRLNAANRKVEVRDLPLDDNINGWSAILPARAPGSPLRGEHTTDWLVVGAGYAGLAFARKIAENRPQERVLLIDAGTVGDNASGRNSGFAIDIPHSVGSTVAELATAANYKRLLQAGARDLKRQVEQYGIACDWREQGKFQASVAAEFSPAMRDYLHTLETLGEPFELFDKAALSKRLGTAYYGLGIFSPGCVLLNPAALTRGLADHLPPNVTLHEATPALSFAFGSPSQVRTPHAEIHARHVMIATNGCAAQLPGLGNQLINLSTYASLTEPLSLEQRERIGDPEDWGVTPVSAVSGATVRYTHDHRILIRQQVAFNPRVRNSAADSQQQVRHHRDIFLARFPALKEVRFAHSWSGLISFTRNGAPRWGEIAPKVYAAVACNGAGIFKQTIAGTTLADFASSVDNPMIADMQALGQPNYVPPRPILDIGVRAYLAKEQWARRREF
jgi:glycine/D-amino acid oxidase-like deaminating enzyme